MKRTKIALMIAAVLGSSSAMADIHAKDVKVSHYGTQEKQNKHFDGRLSDQQRTDEHLQREVTGFKKEVRPQLKELNEGVAENAARASSIKEHADRNTGLGEANARRIDDLGDQHKTTDTRIGQVEGRLSEQKQSFADHLDLQESVDQEQDRQIEDVRTTADADRAEARRNDNRIESESKQRDSALSGRVDDAEQGITDSHNWAVEQFNRQSSVNRSVQSQVDDNTKAIADERADRKQQGREANAGIASAVAIGSHHFDTSYQGMQLSVAGGFYRGEHAQSLSAGGAVSESVFGSISVSHDSRGNQAYGANATFKF